MIVLIEFVAEGLGLGIAGPLVAVFPLVVPPADLSPAVSIAVLLFGLVLSVTMLAGPRYWPPCANNWAINHRLTIFGINRSAFAWDVIAVFFGEKWCAVSGAEL